MTFDSIFVASLLMVAFLASALATALLRERGEMRRKRSSLLAHRIADYRVDPMMDPDALLRDSLGV